MTPRALAMLIALAPLACAGPPLPPALERAAVGTAPGVGLLKSTSSPLYDAPAKVFADASRGSVAMFTMKDQQDAARLVDEVRKRKPALLFTLGPEATLFAKERFASTPTLFAMVFNYRRFGLGNLPN